MKRRLGALVLLLALLPLPSLTWAECPSIVSQAPYITRTLEWLGLTDCIVGVSRYDKLDRPRTGGLLDPDGDALALLSPDLWFASDWAPAKKIAAFTPKGTRAYRLHGFSSMEEVEENLRIIGKAAGLENARLKAAQFARRWRELASEVNGDDRRVLLLSACSGMPYSYGPGTVLYQLFTKAGFRVVETHPKIRQMVPGSEFESPDRLIEHFAPDLVFVFENRLADRCRVLPFDAKVVTLDNALFMHPAPTLLQGLESLKAKRALWSGSDS